MLISKKLVFNTLFIIAVLCNPLFAQNNLMKEVNIAGYTKQPIAHLLEEVSGKQHFSFAYNNKVVPADSLVTLSGYRGTLLGLLEKVLGEDYEFKEVPGYVVLRFAPRRLFIAAEADKDPGGQTVLKGFVRDAADQRPIRQASVYEKNLLLSTLTDDRGYFELKLKNYAGSVLLTVSKEDYRTAAVTLLPEVVVSDKGPLKKYRFYPDNASGSDVEHSRFARFFIGSRQLLQGLNVGNFFATSPYQVSLVPGLGTHGLYNSQVIDHLSLNLIGGYTAGIDGVELASLFNINRKDMRFMQGAAIFNFVGGSTEGVQLAGVYNRVLNNGSGLQIAGLVNKTNHFTGGLQLASLANLDQRAGGVQLTPLMNTMVVGKGVAVAGVMNIARDSSMIQLAGVLNKSGDVAVIQAGGLLNIAKKVRGVQLGLINVADSSDYAVGVINFIRNGEKSISLSMDESFFSHVDFRSGGKVLYGLVGLGYRHEDNKQQYVLQVGIGAHLINYHQFFLNTEYVTAFYRGKGDQDYHSSSIKILPGYNISKHWAMFAAPAIQLASADSRDAIPTNGWVWRRSSAEGHNSTLFAGVSGGILFKWF